MFLRLPLGLSSSPQVYPAGTGLRLWASDLSFFLITASVERGFTHMHVIHVLHNSLISPRWKASFFCQAMQVGLCSEVKRERRGEARVDWSLPYSYEHQKTL